MTNFEALVIPNVIHVQCFINFINILLYNNYYVVCFQHKS